MCGKVAKVETGEKQKHNLSIFKQSTSFDPGFVSTHKRAKTNLVHLCVSPIISDQKTQNNLKIFTEWQGGYQHHAELQGGLATIAISLNQDSNLLDKLNVDIIS